MQYHREYATIPKRNANMHTLRFALNPEGVARIHDVVLCLAKFSEIVSLEARETKVRIFSEPPCPRQF